MGTGGVVPPKIGGVIDTSDFGNNDGFEKMFGATTMLAGVPSGAVETAGSACAGSDAGGVTTVEGAGGAVENREVAALPTLKDEVEKSLGVPKIDAVGRSTDSFTEGSDVIGLSFDELNENGRVVIGGSFALLKSC
jgi:hypothetical protein